MKIRGGFVLAFGSVKGPVRTENQDDLLCYEPSVAASDPLRLVAVADGMGGVAGGAEASRIALRGLLATWIDAAAHARSPRQPDPCERLLEAYRCACDSVAAECERVAQLRGMGTTLTAIALTEDRAFGVHVGDSRCLHLCGGEAVWLTDLHTGGVDDHRLTRAVGAGQLDEEPQTFAVDLHSGDRLLLMTDGFWRAVSEAECVAAVRAVGSDEAVAALLQRAQELDGSDNATLVLCGFDAEDLGEREVREVDAGRHPAIVLDEEAPSRWAVAWPWVLFGVGLAAGLTGWLLRR